MKEIEMQDIKNIIVTVYNLSHEGTLRPEDITDDQLLFDYDQSGAENLELDSLDALEVAAIVEEQYDLTLPYEIEPADISTPRRAFDYLSQLVSAQR